MFPAGFSQNDLTVTVESLPSSRNPAPDIALVSNTYRLKPDGVVFTVPVQISLPYSPGSISQGVYEWKRGVYVFSGTEYEVCPSELDMTNKRIRFSTVHFSDYVIGTPTGSSASGPSRDGVNMIVKNNKVYATFGLVNLFASPGMWWLDQTPWWTGTVATCICGMSFEAITND